MERAVRVFIALIAVLALTLCCSQAQDSSNAQPPFWSALGPGKHAVGFRVLYTRDRKRKWLVAPAGNADPGRPIRISLWYPALPPASAHPMKYGNYLRHDGPAGFRELNEKLDKSDNDSWLSDLRDISTSPDATFATVLSLPVAAYSDAPPAAGRFPLLLFSGGKASRADANVELAEYLASHGYVVATVPQLGPSNQDLDLGSSPQELSLHADDYDSALPILHIIPYIDFTHVASAGHSAGGEVAVELALRHPQISAVIGLDASFGTTGGAKVFKALPEYASGRKVHAALLDLRRANGSQGAKLDLTAIDSLRWSGLYRVDFPNAFHGDFTEWGMTAFKLSIPMPANPDGHTRQMGYDVNRHVCQAVLDFLDARLRNQPGALGKLADEVQGIPGVKVSFTPSRGGPAKN